MGQEIKKPKMWESTTIHERTGCHRMNVICDHDGDKLIRVHLETGKEGACANSLTLALTDALNEVLRLGGTVDNIIQVLEGHECWRKKCCSDIAANCLKKWRDRDEDTKES